MTTEPDATRAGQKFSAILLLTLVAGLFPLSLRAEPQAVDAFQQNQRLGRGVNILGYDPIWGDRGHARFKAEYFRLLKEAGFNSVRINLYPFRQMDEAKDWAIRPAWFAVLDWALDQAQQQGLNVILDLHEYGAMGQHPAANKPKYLAAWRQLGARYQNAPASVFFEVLNEPSHELTPTLWNEYLKEGLAVIRQTNPTRTVIAGPAYWNSIDHLSELEPPAADTNLIVTVHYYVPMDFTHQGAAWAGRRDKLGVDWLGTEQERRVLDRHFGKAQAWAKAHHRPIFLGEFGAYDKAPMDSRVRYIGAVARAAEARGWSWAYWQFDSDFILYDVARDQWVQPILRALIP
jgi:endoglucanase